jgi:integrase
MTRQPSSVPGFGELFVDQIQSGHVDRWKELMGGLMRAGQYSPNTVNSWLAVLRVVLKAAKRDFELPKLATDGVPNFDASSHVTYSEEEPNSLTPEQVGPFLASLREDFPQHYAMAFLGFATGLRPSSLRPLRRKGDEVDVLLDAGKLRVRRSQTLGETVLNTTKQKTRYTIELPPPAIDVIRWHISTQLETPEQRDSPLLFPSVTGGFRTPTVLNKPFAAVSDAIELGYHFTQRGMRRTFNDLMRAAQVEAIVTRSISGHLTERMQDHYSTVSGSEQRASIAKVIALMTPAEAKHAAA